MSWVAIKSLRSAYSTGAGHKGMKGQITSVNLLWRDAGGCWVFGWMDKDTRMMGATGNVPLAAPVPIIGDQDAQRKQT